MFRTEKACPHCDYEPVTRIRAKLYSKSGNRKLNAHFPDTSGPPDIQVARSMVELVELKLQRDRKDLFCVRSRREAAGQRIYLRSCGLKTTIALNSAQNIQHKYMENQKVRMHKTGMNIER